MSSAPKMIETLDQVSGRYRAIFCDVWGVLHNGVQSFRSASEALASARASGLAVVLITNAPRPFADVEAQLLGLGVLPEAYDRIVTSGDVTRELIRNGPRRLFHIGSERELTLYDGLDVELVEEFEASGICCTGLFNDTRETPEDYTEMLRRLRSRDLPMVCANPDIVVERGDDLVWCAGALARDYGLMGGRTLIAGKPHHPIYQAALAAAAEVIGREIAPSEALAIGDGMLTDVKGAADNGFDVLYVSAGVHARDYGPAHAPDLAMLGRFLEKHGADPIGVIPTLR
ncbi:TIGR01459 family HAD-type hydrolase [Tianweitania sediminis]|uniref:TIGR01459 family HAD-type hydrolase n=1 Tax=Tianweitania sediminis TaxID=1502156 RepID=A0A8J7RJW1_9HYPH|nr:TIGR01459 family HAD-type hydrolase [Tianweitania sediminis]MBP0438606.1 TIGR01459 family HAD-type hydrolase [Tianweitania sediminis]